MIELRKEAWQNLSHAYGQATDIPDLLKTMSEFPAEEDYRSEPYFSLWSALCHQGDVYTASYAAVPHIVGFVAAAPSLAPLSLYMLPTCIELSRVKNSGPKIPNELKNEYKQSLRLLGKLAKEAFDSTSNEIRSRCLEAAIAVGKNDTETASTIIDSDDV